MAASGTEAYLTPEARARIEIDGQLEAAGWVVQNYRSMNLSAVAPDGTVPGVAVREFPLKRGHGVVDYLLFVNRQAIGVLEAKKVGTSLIAIEEDPQVAAVARKHLLSALAENTELPAAEDALMVARAVTSKPVSTATSGI